MEFLLEMGSIRGSLSALLLAVAFFVGNSECQSTSREKRNLRISEAIKTCEKESPMECLQRLADIYSLERKIEGAEIVDNFFTLTLRDPQR